MLTFLQEKRKELSQLITFVVTFGVMSKLDFLPDDLVGGELTKKSIEFVISLAVVFVVSDLLLGSPTIIFEWRTESSNRPREGEIRIRVKRQFINLQIKVVGQSLLQRWLLRRSRKYRLSITVQFSPNAAVKITDQGGSGDVRVGDDRQSLVMEKVVLRSGQSLAFSDFTVKRKTAKGYEHEVKVDVTARWEPRICRLPVTLAKIDQGIERLILEA